MEEVRKKVKDKAKYHASDFINFIREQGVVGLAVGLVLGVAGKSVVDSVVNDVFNPIVGMLSGGVNLSDKYFCLGYNGGDCVNQLRYGALLATITSFLIISLIVYIAVHSLHLDKLDKKKEKV